MTPLTRSLAPALIAAAAALLSLPALERPADACSLPPPSLQVNYRFQDGDTLSRDPSLVVDFSSITPVDVTKFTLVDDQGQRRRLELQPYDIDKFTGQTGLLSPASPLSAGQYTLTYRTEDQSMAPPQDYVEEISFTVAEDARFPEELPLGLEWTRVRHPGPTRGEPYSPPPQDSCGTVYAEQNILEVTFPAVCRANDEDIFLEIAYFKQDNTENARILHTISREDFDARPDLQTFEVSRYISTTDTHCIYVTPATSSGVRGDTISLCAPTQCGEAPGASYGDDTDLGPCEGTDGRDTSVPLPEPFDQAQCALQAQFEPDPCDLISCEDNEICVDGACEPDPAACDRVRCLEGDTCVAGECVPIDPCAGVTCGDGEVCDDGVCEQLDDGLLPCDGVDCPEGQECVEPEGICQTVDACQGVQCPDGQACVDGGCQAQTCDQITCPDGQVCADGACVDEGAPDPCEGVSCPGEQICFEGTCYVEAGDGGSMSGQSGGGDSSAAEDGCQIAAGTSPADQAAPWLLVGLGLLGWRRRRS